MPDLIVFDDYSQQTESGTNGTGNRVKTSQGNSIFLTPRRLKLNRFESCD